MIDFEKFKDYLDSEEGQQAMDRMAEKWTKEDDFNKRSKNRNTNNMKAEEFSSLSKEEQQKEVDKCSSFEYFYNNYCKKDDMPDFSQKAWEDYIEQNKKQRFSRRRFGNSYFYPFTPEQSVK